MNKSFRVIFQAATGTYVAVSELTKSNGKTKSSRALRRAVVAGALAFGSAAAMASESCELPDGTVGVIDTAGVCSTTTNVAANGTGSIGVKTADSGTGGIGVMDASLPAGAGIRIGVSGLGTAPFTSQTGDIAIGSGASANGGPADTGTNASVALGWSANASAMQSVAIGTQATASSVNSVALGNDSATGARANVVAVGSVGGERQIINLAAGTLATDAANFGQLSSLSTATATSLSTKLDNSVIKVGSTGTAATAGTVSSIAVGAGSQSLNALDIAVGVNSNASGGWSIAIGGSSGAGAGANSSGQFAIAVGTNSDATANNAIAIGSNGTGAGTTTATAANAVALGANTTASTANSVALGAGSVTGTTRGNVVSIGASGSERQIINVAAGTAATDAVNFGQLTSLSTTTSSGLSTTNSSLSALSTTTSSGLSTTNSSLSALSTTTSSGLSTTNSSLSTLSTTTSSGLSTTNSNVTINTSNINKLADDIGSGTVGLVRQSLSTGVMTVGAETGGTQVDFRNSTGDLRKLMGVADGTAATDAATFGQLRNTGASLATALGGGSVVNADGTVSTPTYTLNGTPVTGVEAAFGNLDGRVIQNTTDINKLADEVGSGTVGLVQQADATSNLTVGATTGGAAVDFSGTGGARTLTGVADGANPNDAVNFSQLTTTNNNVTALDGRVGIAETNITAINTTLADLGSTLDGAVTYNSDKSAVALGGVNGTLINNLAAGLVGAGSMQAVNGGQLFSMKADLDKQLQDIVDNADAAIGIIGSKLDDLTGVVGDQGKQIGDLDDRVGTIEQGIADGTIGGGIGDGTNADGNVELGKGTTASGKNSSAIGSGAVASGESSSAVGANASATGKDSTALGADSQATGSNSVAIGAGSVAERDNSVSFGSAGNERQLTNVADGTAPTDAVNVRQLDNAIAGVGQRIDDVEKIAFGGIAMAGALAALPQVEPGKTFSLGAGLGNYASYTALALGASARVAPNTIVKMGISTTSGKRSLINAGVGHSW